MFDPWSVVGVLLFGMRVRASIAVRVKQALLFHGVEGVLGVHASEGHQQSERLCGGAGLERHVER